MSNIVVFAIVLVAAVGLFAWSCYRRFGLIWLGRPEDRFNPKGKRFGSLLVYAIGQRKVLTRAFGTNHAFLHWAFLVLLVANTEFLLNGLSPAASFSRLPAGAYYTLALIFDIVSLVALLAVVAAVVRRFTFPPPHIEARSPDAFTILGLVAILMLAFFGLNASEIAAGSEAAARYMPISSLVATLFAGIPKGSLEGFANAFWWVHALVLLGFLNYLPYSKHMHVMTAVPNCYFRSLERITTHPREEFKKDSTFGVGQVGQFTWHGLFDSYSCAVCGRCSDACPATFVGRALDPQKIVHDIKVNLLANGSLLKKKEALVLPLIGAGKEGSISEEAIWDCTTCGACVQACPVCIEQFPRIIDMRRHLVEMKAKFPEELLAFFENMEQRSNPWGIAPAERTKWAAELQVQPFDPAKTEYLFYVGCAGAFDARNRRTSLALTKILTSAGLSWGILGKDEMCCGDSLRRLGNEYVFERMANANVKMFKDKGVKKVVVTCPHCYNVFKNDYRQYGLELDVVHHTQLIPRLIEEGRLKLGQKADLGKVVFHDSCYLGRYNVVYDEPRRAVALATGQPPVEMERRRENGFCCGGGGGRMWLEEPAGKHVNVARVTEALGKDPKTVAVSCPYCMTMFEDGLKDKNAEDRVEVLDVAEIVAKALK